MSIRFSQYGNRLHKQPGTLPTSLHAFTVCGFLKVGVLPASGEYAYVVYMQGAAGSSGNAVYVDSSGNFRGDAEWGSFGSASAGTLSAGGAAGANWYFFAWRGTGTGSNGMRVSLKPAGSGTLTTVSLTFNNATTGVEWMALGSSFPDGQWGSRTVNGYFAHLKLFNRALSDAELAAEAAQTVPTASNLLSYHAFTNSDVNTALQPTQGSGAWVTNEVAPTYSSDEPVFAVSPTLTGNDTLPLVASTSVSYSRPTADVTSGWFPSSGTVLYEMIDEELPSSLDYIFASAAGQTGQVRMQTIATPVALSSVTVNYVVQDLAAGASVTVSLYDGGTLIKTDTARTANGTYSMTVTSAEWAAVSNWANIQLRFVSG